MCGLDRTRMQRAVPPVSPCFVTTPTHLRFRFDRILLPRGPAVSIWNCLTWSDLVMLRCSHRKQCLLSSSLLTHTHLGRLFERAPIAEKALRRGARQTCGTPFDTASRWHRAVAPVSNEFLSREMWRCRATPGRHTCLRAETIVKARLPRGTPHCENNTGTQKRGGNLCRHRDSRSQRRRLPYLCANFV